jgi:putative ABC transport system permease protein
VTPLRTKLLRDLRRQAVQFGAVAVTVFLGITLFGASYDSFQNLTASYEETAQVSRFANLTVAGGDIEAFVEAARSEAGVEVVETRTVSDVSSVFRRTPR